MRILANKTRVLEPDSDFPFGKIKDRNATERGTPVNEELYGDMHQFFAKLFAASGLTANDLPESEYSGFQLFQALLKVNNKYNAAVLVQSLMGDSYTTDDLIVLFGVKITLSGGNNTANWTEGAILYNGALYLVPASTGGGITKSGGQEFFFIIDDEDDQIITISYGDSGSGLADYNDNSVKYLKKEVPTNTGMTAFSVSNCSLLTARINTLLSGDMIHFSLQVNITIITGTVNTSIKLNKISGLDLYPDSFNNFPIAGIFKLNDISGSPSLLVENQITQGLNSTDVSVDVNGRLTLTVDDSIVSDGTNVSFIVNGTMKRAF
jgi:hypothetical protein